MNIALGRWLWVQMRPNFLGTMVSTKSVSWKLAAGLDGRVRMAVFLCLLKVSKFLRVSCLTYCESSDNGQLTSWKNDEVVQTLLHYRVRFMQKELFEKSCTNNGKEWQLQLLEDMQQRRKKKRKTSIHA